MFWVKDPVSSLTVVGGCGALCVGDACTCRGGARLVKPKKTKKPTPIPTPTPTPAPTPKR